METLLFGIAVLACPLGMGVMMWFMAKGMRKGSRARREPSVDELRTEHARLGGEIERLEASRRRPDVSRTGR